MQASPHHGTRSDAGLAPHATEGGTGAVGRRAPVPVRPVDRPDLLAWLNADATTLVSVVAGAGWGKSTLIDQWRDDPNRSAPLAVVGVEDSIAAPAAFLARIVAAAAAVVPGPGWEHAAQLLAGPDPDLAGTVLPVLREAFVRSGPILVALDDLHRVTDPAGHTVLAALIDALPRGSRFLLASRRPLPVPLGRLRAAGRLVELGPGNCVWSGTRAPS